MLSERLPRLQKTAETSRPRPRNGRATARPTPRSVSAITAGCEGVAHTQAGAVRDVRMLGSVDAASRLLSRPIPFGRRPASAHVSERVRGRSAANGHVRDRHGQQQLPADRRLVRGRPLRAAASIEKRTLGVGDDVARHGRISDAKLAEIARRSRRSRPPATKTAPRRSSPSARRPFATRPTGRGRSTSRQEARHRDGDRERARESELAYLVGSLGQDGYAVIDNGSRSIELVSKDRRRAAASGLQPRIPRRVRDVFRGAPPIRPRPCARFSDQLRQHAAKRRS